jgi:hypothetical protein
MCFQKNPLGSACRTDKINKQQVKKLSVSPKAQHLYLRENFHLKPHMHRDASKLGPKSRNKNRNSQKKKNLEEQKEKKRKIHLHDSGQSRARKKEKNPRAYGCIQAPRRGERSHGHNGRTQNNALFFLRSLAFPIRKLKMQREEQLLRIGQELG